MRVIDFLCQVKLKVKDSDTASQTLVQERVAAMIKRTYLGMADVVNVRG